MRFFADRARLVAPRHVARGLRERVGEVSILPAGPARHAALAALLVDAGGLAQGVADAERDAAGADVFGPGEEAAAGIALAVARALWASWRSGGTAPAPPAAIVDPLLAAPLPEAVSIRRPEGFALYGLYPETYAAAGRSLAGSGARVLGIRSIGTALAAMVAAGAEGQGASPSVRPGGHPFTRHVRLALDLAQRLGAHRGPVAIVDEGPGLSGSSFLAVADALEGLGVPASRLHLFPSHPGPPGGAATPGARARYERLARHHVPFEALFLSDAPLALARLVEDVVGPLDAPPLDLSAGAWRPLLFDRPRDWPPTEGWRERRKYLLRAGGRTWIARFAGLGTPGERARERATALAAAGLVPSVAGLRHGFLVEAFAADARPLPLGQVPRARLLAAVRRHLAFVASRFPAREGEGARPRELAEVAEENARELVGDDTARALRALMTRHVPEVQRRARPVEVDGRLQRWEWLVGGGGRIVKTDAVDHHVDHALVGCQDALWDVAGAVLELGLAPREASLLAAAVREAAPGAPPRCLPFFLGAYAAFEAGRWSALAAEAGAGPDADADDAAALPALEPAARSLAQVVPVDYAVPGCPPTASLLWTAALALLGRGESTARASFAAGRLPARVADAIAAGVLPPRGSTFAGERAVCGSCSRVKEEKRFEACRRPFQAYQETGRCLLEQGLVCQGIATQEGCGGLCTGAGAPCRGCFGKAPAVFDPGAKMVAAIGSTFDSGKAEEIAALADGFLDLAGTFYRYTAPSQCALLAAPRGGAGGGP